MTHNLVARGRMVGVLVAVFSGAVLCAYSGEQAKQAGDEPLDIETASLSALKSAFGAPLPDDHALSAYLDTPQCRLTMGWIRDFIDDYVYRSMMPSQTPHPLPAPLATEYARRFNVAGKLYEKDPNAIAEWFWSRKDRENVTVLDALVFAATDTAADAAGETYGKGPDLFHARNPVVRMFAARHVAQVVKEDERPALIEHSLNDAYWYTRKKALNWVRGMEVDKRDPILRKYLEASKKEAVPEQFETRKASMEKDIEAILKHPDSK